MGADLDLAYMPAAELARRIRLRDVSPVEVVANSLQRIEEVNPRLNCFCFVWADEALAAARAATEPVVKGSDVASPRCTGHPEGHDPDGGAQDDARLLHARALSAAA